jgi:hypothetical protein
MNKQLLKYELVYTSPIWIMLTGLLSAFTVFSIFDFQILSGPAFDVDYWGALFTMFLSMFIIIIWSQKIKESRLRIHALLPITQKQLAETRSYFYGLPAAVILLYVVIAHLILLSNWKEEASTLLAQSGWFFTIFFTFLAGRDIWHSYESDKNLKQIIAALIIGTTLISVVVLIVYSLPFLYKAVPDSISRFTFLYSKIIFYVLAFIALLLLSQTFKKRHSYFS